MQLSNCTYACAYLHYLAYLFSLYHTSADLSREDRFDLLVYNSPCTAYTHPISAGAGLGTETYVPKVDGQNDTIS